MKFVDRRRRSHLGFQMKRVSNHSNTSLCDMQSAFLKSVKLYNSGDFSNSARNMEQAITHYFEIYGLCLAGCEGSYEILEFKDFYPTLAGNRGAI